MYQRTSVRVGFCLFITIFFSISCCKQVTKTTTKQQFQPDNQASAGPPTIIYKTKSDYAKLIPVILSDDKTRIVSFPAVKDIYFDGQFAYPTLLHNGFLLDNRGISQNVAFLRITYEEYSKLEKTPEAAKLMGMILEKDPLEVMYQCGSRYQYKNLVDELNQCIDNNQLNKFRKLK